MSASALTGAKEAFPPSVSTEKALIEAQSTYSVFHVKFRDVLEKVLRITDDFFLRLFHYSSGVRQGLYTAVVLQQAETVVSQFFI